MNRNIALDILRFTMAFMIVGIHAGFLGEFSTVGQYITVNGLFRIAVPIFLLINGFYFYPVLAKNNHINWFKKIFIIYVVWMLFYSYFWFINPELSFFWFAKLIYKMIIGFHHLWYISGLIGAAIILLLLRNLSSSLLSILIISTFLCGVLIQYLGNYHILENTIFDTLFNLNCFHRNMFFFSFPFFSIGYLINKHSLHQLISFQTVSILSIFGLLILLGESYLNYIQGTKEDIDNLFTLILACPFIFILFMKSNISSKNKNIALYASSIYFIHIFFLFIFNKFIDIEATYLTLSVFLTSALASYFIIKINKKLKFIL